MDSNRFPWPLISVVIPAYNAQDWIEETIFSVLHQSYPPERLEIIIVDDGSTDQTIAKVESIVKDSPIRYHIVRAAHRGPSSARNLGWQLARGEWIQFLDSDDLLHREKIAIQAYAACFLPEEIAVVYSEWQRIALVHHKWRPVGEVVSPRIGDDPLSDLLKTENFIATGSQLVRRAWLEKIGGFNEQHWLIEDVDLLLRIAMGGGRFHYVSKGVPLFFYRQHSDGSLSRRDRQKFIVGCVRNALMVEDYWRANATLNPERSRLLADIYFQAARYFAEVDPKEFEAMVQKIESLLPRFQPPGPSSLRWVARFLGYRKAERVALLYRHLKKHFKRQ